MWERSQCEANASCTGAAFPQSLMLPGPIIALDPCSYEVGLGHAGVGKKPWKLVGFILKRGKITALEELHGNRSLPKSTDPTRDGLKGKECCSLSVAKNKRSFFKAQKQEEAMLWIQGGVVSLFFAFPLHSMTVCSESIRCVNLTSLSLRRFAVWNVVPLGKHLLYPLKWWGIQLPVVLLTAEELTHCFC